MARQDDETPPLHDVSDNTDPANAGRLRTGSQQAEEELARTQEALTEKTEELRRTRNDRQQAEHGVRQQSEWLRVTLDSIGDGVITTDLAGRVTSLNPVAEELTGWTREEAQGQPLEQVFRILNEYSRHPVENPALRALREGQVVGLANHTLLIARDGSERAIDDSAAPIRDEAGRVAGVVLIFRDVSQRRRDEARMRASEETSRFLAAASATLAELSDYHSTLQRVASLAVPAFADWCVVDAQEPDGRVRRLAVVQADPAKAGLAQELARRLPRPLSPHGALKVLRTGEPEWLGAIPDSLLLEAAHDDEHLRILRELAPTSSLCVPIRSRGTLHGALSFVTTDSGRVYSRDDLETAQDLADRAAVAIDNANLVAALQESDRRKDEFLAMLAHELRNPLAPIRNVVQIFRVKCPPIPELQYATEVIDRQVHQMTRLIDDLLDISRITLGKIELRKQRVELATVVQSAVEAAGPLLEKWGHELTVTLPTRPIYLEADLTRLSQVLMNLLNNAAKYMDGPGQIWLSAEADGGEVRIRVKDTGIGIPAEMLPRIFDMFTQADRFRDHSEDGLGIGLTLVRRLVEMHGGRVSAHSTGPGQGSEFVVRLTSVAADQDPDEAGETIGKGDPGRLAAGLRIVVADDNRDAAESLALLLSTQEHDVQTVYDGLTAVEVAAAYQPDVVFLDIGMPKLNGHEAARRIREQPGGAGRLLVALTGWGQDEDRRQSSAAGFDHHMTKPIGLSDLERVLVEAQARRQP